VPFTSFSENKHLPDGTRPPVWFALDETRSLAFFAGIWTRWTWVRKVKEGEPNDLFAFLTTDANQVVGRRADVLCAVGKRPRKKRGLNIFSAREYPQRARHHKPARTTFGCS